MAKVLVIEDNAAVRKAMVGILSTLGRHEVVAARDGEEGLRMLAAGIDVVVTDIWMPGQDGIAFLKRAKAVRPGLPVVVVTGGGPNFPPIELSVSVVESHAADAVLIKPFEDQDLLDAVSRLVSGGG